MHELILQHIEEQYTSLTQPLLQNLNKGQKLGASPRVLPCIWFLWNTTFPNLGWDQTQREGTDDGAGAIRSKGAFIAPWRGKLTWFTVGLLWSFYSHSRVVKIHVSYVLGVGRTKTLSFLILDIVTLLSGRAVKSRNNIEKER